MIMTANIYVELAGIKKSLNYWMHYCGIRPGAV
jgi:hypothetical protein